MIDAIAIVQAIEGNPFYLFTLSFFAWYPLVSSAILVFASIVFFLRREKGDNTPEFSDEFVPMVSVVLAAFNESDDIKETVEGCLRIEYPDYEVIVVDDGSKDDTAGVVKPFVDAGKVRLVRKVTNEGKAMALNDALQCANGEVFLIIDADAVPDPQILHYMVPHFRDARVGAVTGNPRVFNRESLLAKLQVIEFASIVSLQRRAQRVWGRILTMSGVVGAFHRNAIFDVGLFSPDMATEDIDLSWKLQLRFYDIRYEPRAVVWMRVPATLRGLWRQRRRWATGLGQVLRRHGRRAMGWKTRRQWPLVIEAWASIFWAYCFVVLTLLWIFCYWIGYPPLGASPIPNWWGMLIGTMCLIQLMTGMLMDRKYDSEIPLYYFTAIFYPLLYWMLMAVITAISTPKAILQSPDDRGPVKWKPVRGES